MKAAWPTVLLLVGLYVLPPASNSQTTFAIGPQFGLNIGTCSLTPELPSTVTKGGRTGMIFGVNFEVGFANMFYAATQIQYAQKGYTLSGPGGKGTYSFNYMDFVTLFKVKFLRGKIRPYGLLGSSFGVMLTATETVELVNQAARDVDWSKVIGSDFALHFGGGAEYAVAKRISIIGDLRYMLGLKNIYSNAADPNFSVKPGGFVITFGGLFYL